MSRPRVAMAGNPNTGKTSVFNRLTGSQGRVGNYPGVTVELLAGELDLGRAGRVEVLTGASMAAHRAVRQGERGNFSACGLPESRVPGSGSDSDPAPLF